MKVKFILLTCTLLFARGCDFYSTQLWFFQENGMAGETNPLTRYFGIGFTGLLVTNFIVISLIIYLLFYFYFKYKRPERLSPEPANYQEYASMLYFGKPNRFYQIFFSAPLNLKPFMAHMGYVFTIVIIVGSFLATFHNVSQFNSFEFYNQYRQIIGRPLYVIYALIGFTFMFTLRNLYLNEYHAYKKFLKPN